MSYNWSGACEDLLHALSNLSAICAGGLLLGAETLSEFHRIESEISEIKKKM